MFGKKLIVLAGFIVAVLAVGAWAVPGPYEVSGTGGDYDGEYNYAGFENDGVPYFTKNFYYLWRSDTLHTWRLDDTVLDVYANEDTGDTPPSTGWTTNVGGEAPTVSLVPVEISSFSIE